MNITEVPDAAARKALESAKGDYRSAQLPDIAERERLLKELRETLAALALPEKAELGELLAQGEARVKEKDERNRKLSARTVEEFRNFVAEAKRLVDTKDEVPGKKLEDILNRYTGILLEQLLIDLRWQMTQTYLHALDPVRYPDEAVPTADLLDSAKVRKR